MEKVENGIFVSVDYKGTLANGEVFDTSRERQPLEIQMGAGQLIKGFENELMGMTLDEKWVFTLAPEDAYGQRDESLTQSFPTSEVPPGMNPQVGMTIGLTTPEGRQVPARIVHLDDEKLTMDLNHPLAGESLTFEIEVVGISSTQTQTPMSCGSGCDCSSGCDH
ncbi:MAG: peptidylprolyl isomerase [Deltaproteobacteria bacterium]|nr:peptidylprolyl isomerase [Deltaproteobacteria bacterium]